MSLLLIVAIAVGAITLLIVLALAPLAEGSEEADPDPDTDTLVTLAAVRSPSGRPFFPPPSPSRTSSRRSTAPATSAHPADFVAVRG